jgi:hypothetical protein
MLGEAREREAELRRMLGKALEERRGLQVRLGV